jgi:diguanylate cyclase (GGDEF)-like protein
MHLDIRTILVLIMVSAFAIGAAMFHVARHYPSYARRALNFWAGATTLHGVCYLLLSLRGLAPDFLSVVIANTLAVGALALNYSAVMEIQRQPYRLKGFAALTLLIFASFCYFLYVDNNVAARIALIGVTAGGLIALIGYRFMAQKEHSKRGIYRLTGLLYMATAAALLFRGGHALTTNAFTQGLLTRGTIHDISFLAIFLTTVIGALYFTLIVGDEMTGELRRIATLDSLTEIYNRRTFDELANKELARAGRSGAAISLLEIDLDHFKQVNDKYGHAVGDIVLKATTAAISAELRQQDLFGRHGGEEFCVLLPDTDAERVRTVAERIRHRVEISQVPAGSDQLAVTISIGVATFAPGKDFNTLMLEADLALYRAKAEGRNRVAAAPIGV